MTLNTTRFQRTQFTWLAYTIVAIFAYAEALLGPLMPFLRSELGFNYTVAGLHFSAFSLGVAASGIITDWVAARIGRHLTILGGGAGLAAAVILLAVGHSVIATIASAGLMGILGGMMFIVGQAALSDHQPRFRTIALTEANIAASMVVTIEPLFIGSFQKIGLGWRLTLWLIAAVFLAVGWFTRHVPIPTETESDTSDQNRTGTKLPPIFWLYWLVLFFGVAIEWSAAFWGAEFLEAHVALPKTTAVTLMSIFFAAAVLARFLSSRLAHRISGETLLLFAIGFAVAGFSAFWLGGTPGITIAGLFVMGFGIANFYPLALSQAMHTAQGMANLASARITIGTGSAVFLMPLLLGNIADRNGIWFAFGLLGILLAAILGVTLFANRLAHQHTG